MKKWLAFLIIVSVAVTSFNAAAQAVTKYGDNVSTLNGIIKAYYDVVTVKKGGKIFYQRDSILHWPNVNIGEAGLAKNGTPIMRYMSLKEYHHKSDALLEKDGFNEREISRKVEKFGNIYHVWSTYESRNTATGPIIERGINSIEMFFDGKRFWILGWFFDGERKNNPIPAAYLTK